MNLIENYIKKIHSEKDITKDYIKKIGKAPLENLIEVDLDYDCYGSLKRDNIIFTESQWKEVKRQGYFLG